MDSKNMAELVHLLEREVSDALATNQPAPGDESFHDMCSEYEECMRWQGRQPNRCFRTEVGTYSRWSPKILLEKQTSTDL